jgi:hypothetical protein
MNTTTTTTNLPTIDSQISNIEKKDFFNIYQSEKKTGIKSLSLRPSKSIKRNSSLKPMSPIKIK